MNVCGLRRGSQSPHPRSKFTPDEDGRLSELVQKYGIDAWQQLSRHMPGRNSRQCRDRWMNFLSPDITKAPWSEQEETLLCQKIMQLGNTWKRIAVHFPGRSEVNVKSHWQVMQRRFERDIINGGQSGIAPPRPEVPPVDLEPLFFADEDAFDRDFESWRAL